MSDRIKEALERLDRGERSIKSQEQENSGSRKETDSLPGLRPYGGPTTTNGLRNTTYGLRPVNESADSVNGKNEK